MNPPATVLRDAAFLAHEKPSLAVRYLWTFINDAAAALGPAMAALTASAALEAVDAVLADLQSTDGEPVSVQDWMAITSQTAFALLLTAADRLDPKHAALSVR